MDLSAGIPAPRYDEQQRRARLGFVNFTARDEFLLREMSEWIAPELDAIVDEFYRQLTGHDATRALFGGEQQLAELKQKQKAYLLKCLRGPYDEDYFLQRWRIGAVHNRVRVEPTWYLGAYQIYRRIIFPRITSRHLHDGPALLERLLALDKVMTIDMAVALDSYWAHYNATVEEMRAMNAEIRAASEAKSQFLAHMSHEFRTPLNAILGFAEVLRDQLAGPLNAEQLEYLEDVHRAGQVLLRLINDVLDLAKIEAGRFELFHETVDIARAIRDAVTVVRGAAEKKQLSLQLRLDPALGTMQADEVRFKQILYNLLSNAVKFTDRGGVTLGAALEGEWLHLRVEDTGVGIREEDRELIFREFSQLEPSHGRVNEGTGLGLALTRRLVEAHGGRIWVESHYGDGSTFHVMLPLQQGGREEHAR